MVAHRRDSFQVYSREIASFSIKRQFSCQTAISFKTMAIATNEWEVNRPGILCAWDGQARDPDKFGQTKCFQTTVQTAINLTV